MNVGITIETSISKEHGVISLSMFDETMAAIDPPRRAFVTEVIRTKDKAIHDALVALGWTPPKPGVAEATES